MVRSVTTENTAARRRVLLDLLEKAAIELDLKIFRTDKYGKFLVNGDGRMMVDWWKVIWGIVTIVAKVAAKRRLEQELLKLPRV